ncbi:carotenoid oxygenase family protein [Streptomyces tuirus]|uniref:Dioxygenase n=1 Tax=Streptomyces tuirus TaxID=68278 RepID=A0A7G1NUJ3_9ACTN|nr:hypothetical protein GCM10017668_65880 [Streptomyces tuirus]
MSTPPDPTRRTHSSRSGAPDLVILAAQVTGGPVARIQLPGRVRLGFHGSRIPDA